MEDKKLRLKKRLQQKILKEQKLRSAGVVTGRKERKLLIICYRFM